VTGFSISGPESLSILALGAHADDIEIGAAGLILELLEAGRVGNLDWIVLSAEGARADEARASAHALVGDRAPLSIEVGAFRERYFPYQAEIKESFDALGRRVRPDLVVAPRLEDRHQDHRIVSELAWQTFRNSLILEYEIPKYEGDLGSPNIYVPLAPQTLDRKVDHLLAAFPSQRDRAWLTAETFWGIARIRGIEAGSTTGYAEAFTCRKASLLAPGASPGLDRPASAGRRKRGA
jgi:LmbE family N-acetylglucosaminyl deacetylase